jgi:hypothetical protein
MTVDGMQENEGKSFNNIDHLQKIFIETTANSTDKQLILYTDQIEFDAELQR